MKGGIDMDFASFDSQEMPVADPDSKRSLFVGRGGWVVKPYTVYVNPYFVYNGDGYVQDISPDRFTKHYYAGSERIASRLNREGQNATEHTTSTIYSPTAAYAPVLVNLQAALSAFGLNDQLDTDPAGYPPNPIEAPEDCQEQFGNDQMEIERCLCLHFPAEAALQSIECYSYEPIYWYHPDYLGHTDFVTDRTGQPYQHFFYAPFGEALLSQHTGTGYYNTPYRFNAKELDSETGLIYYGARYYEPKESVWLSVDPLSHERSWVSPFNFVQNNPISKVDPTGELDWIPDANGNLIAERGDNAQTLARFLSISVTEAQNQLNNQGYVDNFGNNNLQAGDLLTIDNVYTRSLAKDGSLPYGHSQLDYNCWGSAIAGSNGREIKVGVGIDSPVNFDSNLIKNYQSVESNQAVFGKTILRFTSDNPYAESSFDSYESQGLVSRNPNSRGGSLHGAVFYGRSNDGTTYIYTKNGWNEAPRIMKLSDLENNSTYNYGTVRGLKGNSGYYNKK